jgi:AcrR family transcriptional regulator
MSTQDGAAPSRLQRKRSRRIEQILTVAAELFGERGYAAVSLEDVAERLDLTKGSLYHYFAGKDELATAAIEALGDEWNSRLAELAAGLAGPPAPRLRALLREHITIAVREHPAALGLFLALDQWPRQQRDRIKELRRRHDALFRRAVTDGIAAGEFSVVDVDTALQVMHAAMSQAHLWCGQLTGDAQDRALDQLADTLMALVRPVRLAAS